MIISISQHTNKGKTQHVDQKRRNTTISYLGLKPLSACSEKENTENKMLIGKWLQKLVFLVKVSIMQKL